MTARSDLDDSIMGETGVRHVMKGLLADLDIMFNVSTEDNWPC